jgi:hypothetical protein
MPKPTDKPKGSTADMAWRPRIETQRVLHSFTNVNQEPDPLTESPNITDPNEDTAPLQGSLDRSDDDSLGNDDRADDERHSDDGHSGKGKE